MNVKLLCIGDRVPDWVREGTQEYAKRIRNGLGFSLVEIPLAKRTRSTSVEVCLQKEATALLKKIDPNDHVVALEIKGKSFSTAGLARQLESLLASGQNLSLLIGGPDGLHQDCRQRADSQWSLSELTLPHPLARIVVVEQLYRAMSLLHGHPYHRE